MPNESGVRLTGSSAAHISLLLLQHSAGGVRSHLASEREHDWFGGVTRIFQFRPNIQKLASRSRDR